jgi:hypothetical protein
VTRQDQQSNFQMEEYQATERSRGGKKKSALCGADLLDTNLDIDSKKYPFAIQR